MKESVTSLQHLLLTELYKYGEASVKKKLVLERFPTGNTVLCNKWMLFTKKSMQRLIIKSTLYFRFKFAYYNEFNNEFAYFADLENSNG